MGDENEDKEVGPKPQMDSKKRDDETYVYCSRKKKKTGKKTKKVRINLSNCLESSMLSIVTSLNDNCCLCCGAFMRYMRSVLKCLSCFATCHIPQVMELERLFCELLDAAGDACLDLICFIRKFLHVCVGLDKK